MSKMSSAMRTGRGAVQFSDPPFAQSLLGNTRWAWLWLLVRVYVGYSWITASLEKLDNPAWMQTGAALKGFWQSAVQTPAPPAHAPIAFAWYRAFIMALLNGGHYVWFAKVVSVGELAIGIALVIGAFTGIAAFVGGFMNWNFMMAGSASINPVLFALSIFLILAWKTAGWLGLDRVLLPAIGTPWRRGAAFGGATTPRPEEGRISESSAR